MIEVGQHALTSTPCPNFGILELRKKTEFVDAVGMLRKKLNYHSISETIQNLTVHSQLLQNYFSCAKIKMLNNLTGKCPKFGQGVQKLGHATLFSWQQRL